MEEGIVPIYENETKEKLINARELFYELRGHNTKTKFADWIAQRIKHYEFIENEEFIKLRNFTKVGNLERPYEIQYIRNTKSGKKGEIKEKGYKIENICYKIT